MLQLGLAVAAAFILQAVLSLLQMRHFSKEFIKLRRQGKVACGRKAGGFHAGAIVMFLIDDDGIIQTARKLEGVTCFARVRPLKGFEGKYIGSLTGEEVAKNHKKTPTNTCTNLNQPLYCKKKFYEPSQCIIPHSNQHT